MESSIINEINRSRKVEHMDITEDGNDYHLSMNITDYYVTLKVSTAFKSNKNVDLSSLTANEPFRYSLDNGMLTCTSTMLLSAKSKKALSELMALGLANTKIVKMLLEININA